MLDLHVLPKSTEKSAAAQNLTKQVHFTQADVRSKPEESKARYKEAADKRRQKRVFVDDMMIFLRKERFPVGQHNKMQPKKYGPKQIDDNAYIVYLPKSMSISSTFNVADINPFYPDDESLYFGSN